MDIARYIVCPSSSGTFSSVAMTRAPEPRRYVCRDSWILYSVPSSAMHDMNVSVVPFRSSSARSCRLHSTVTLPAASTTPAGARTLLASAGGCGRERRPEATTCECLASERRPRRVEFGSADAFFCCGAKLRNWKLPFRARDPKLVGRWSGDDKAKA
eukprot:3954956-Prymnesium_polylepis.1